jgi:hypothetical protein
VYALSSLPDKYRALRLNRAVRRRLNGGRLRVAETGPKLPSIEPVTSAAWKANRWLEPSGKITFIGEAWKPPTLRIQPPQGDAEAYSVTAANVAVDGDGGDWCLVEARASFKQRAKSVVNLDIRSA